MEISVENHRFGFIRIEGRGRSRISGPPTNYANPYQKQRQADPGFLQPLCDESGVQDALGRVVESAKFTCPNTAVSEVRQTLIVSSFVTPHRMSYDTEHVRTAGDNPETITGIPTFTD